MKKEIVSVAIGGLVLGFVMGLVTPKLFNTETDEHNHTTQSPPSDAPAKPTLDQFEHIISEYKSLLEADPGNVDAWFQLGNMYYAAEQPQQALESYNKALEIESQHIGVLTQMGNLYFDTEQYQKAIDYYRRVLAIDPGLSDVRIDMAIMYRRLGQPDEAVRQMKQVIKTDPKHAMAQINLGIILRYDKQDSKGAIDVWQGFVDKLPDDPQVPKVKEMIQQAKDQASLD